MRRGLDFLPAGIERRTAGVTWPTRGENTAPTGTPSISGTPQVGETLSASVTEIADADGLTTATFSYQWVTNDGDADTDVDEATSSTYTLTAAEHGKR